MVDIHGKSVGKYTILTMDPNGIYQATEGVEKTYTVKTCLNTTGS